MLSINSFYQSLTSKYSPNPDQIFWNNMYWVSTGICFFLIGLTLANRKLKWLIFPVSVIINVRNMFRLLDFENSKYITDGRSKNPFMMPVGTWGYLAMSQYAVYLLSIFIQINCFDMIKGSRWVMFIQMVFSSYAVSVSFEASRIPQPINLFINICATFLIFWLLIFLTQTFPIIIGKFDKIINFVYGTARI